MYDIQHKCLPLLNFRSHILRNNNIKACLLCGQINDLTNEIQRSNCLVYAIAVTHFLVN